MFGLRQSGLPEFRTARISSDRDLIEASRNLLQKLFEQYNHLDTFHQNLYKYLEASAISNGAYQGGA